VITLLVASAFSAVHAQSRSDWLKPPPAKAWFKLAYRYCSSSTENGGPVKQGGCMDHTQLIGLTQAGYIWMRDKYVECPFNGPGDVRRIDVTSPASLISYVQLECRTDGSAVTLTQTNTQKFSTENHSEPTLIKAVITVEMRISGESCVLSNYSRVTRTLTPERWTTYQGKRFKTDAEDSTSRATLERATSCTFFRSYEAANAAPD
jgi:hypothetical protein